MIGDGARRMQRLSRRRHLMHEAELSFRRQGVNYVFLHASEAGRPLYESLGFAPTTEMAITLPAWDA